ncbi:hypothetical protein BC937DRAFT_87041 [Endogone sp. FLAS-F59071]|nr:hypothetical protein BC937DRAFT_87041 [Endogone sp. FLAS-F59071]|eukprot:RUS22771.1 hypothetical protein BC937DRAFT_87041 [Endogone sp. FLAS-F59071]
MFDEANAEMSREELLAAARKKLKSFQRRRTMSVSFPHDASLSSPLSPSDVQLSTSSPLLHRSSLPPETVVTIPEFKIPSKFALLARRKSVESAVLNSAIVLPRKTKPSVSSGSAESLGVGCTFWKKRVQTHDFCSGCDIRTVESPTEDMSTQSMFNVRPRPSQSTPFLTAKSHPTPPTAPVSWHKLRSLSSALPDNIDTSPLPTTPSLLEEPEPLITSGSGHRHSLTPLPIQSRSSTTFLSDLHTRFPTAVSAATPQTYTPLPNLQESLIWVAQNTRLLAERERMREEAEKLRKELEQVRKEVELFQRETAGKEEIDLSRNRERRKEIVSTEREERVTEKEVQVLAARVREQEEKYEKLAVEYRAEQGSWAKINGDLHEQLIAMTKKKNEAMKELEKLRGISGRVGCDEMEIEGRIAEVKGRERGDGASSGTSEEDGSWDEMDQDEGADSAPLSPAPHQRSSTRPRRALSIDSYRHVDAAALPTDRPSSLRFKRLLSVSDHPAAPASLFPFSFTSFGSMTPATRTSLEASAASSLEAENARLRKVIAERERMSAEIERLKEERDAWKGAARNLEKRVLEVETGKREGATEEEEDEGLFLVIQALSSLNILVI